jgi:hypothetical protein
MQVGHFRYLGISYFHFSYLTACLSAVLSIFFTFHNKTTTIALNRPSSVLFSSYLTKARFGKKEGKAIQRFQLNSQKNNATIPHFIAD